MRLKFSISLHLLQTVGLWEFVCASVCFYVFWLSEPDGVEYDKCG